jgi:hypothetical protein
VRIVTAIEQDVEAPGQITQVLQDLLEELVGGDRRDGAVELLVEAQELDEVALGAEPGHVVGSDELAQLAQLIVLDPLCREPARISMGTRVSMI